MTAYAFPQAETCKQYLDRKKRYTELLKQEGKSVDSFKALEDMRDAAVLIAEEVCR